MKTFYLIVANILFGSVSAFFVWFAMVFWVYLETQSVISTSIIGGTFMAFMALSGFWLGAIVDHHKKKYAMLLSSFGTLFFFCLALLLYVTAPEGAFSSLTNPRLWMLVFTVLLGVIAGNLRGIALPTLVTMLVPKDRHAQANGLSGIVMGASSFGAGITSGFALAYAGIFWVFVIGIVATIITILHLLTITIPEAEIVHTAEKPKKVDIRGTIKAIGSVPGLSGLIFFTMFNNFLGGVFGALMDAYGLSLVSVEVWGTLWGVLSLGFIVGGFYIAKNGLGKDPLRNLFRINTITWITCILFTIQPSVVLLGAGILVWVILMPFIEATEHTIVQKVVPLERQGRVFGFSQSIEMSASPIASFLAGPIAQLIFIPFMTTGAGVGLIGSWFGVGPGRGIALVFMLAGVIGLLVTSLARHSRSYKLLSSHYQQG